LHTHACAQEEVGATEQEWDGLVEEKEEQ